MTKSLLRHDTKQSREGSKAGRDLQTTAHSWQAEGRNIKLIRRCRSQPSPVRHVSNASKLRRHVRRRRTVQSVHMTSLKRK